MQTTAAALSLTETQQRLDDVVECPICYEAFNDPRSLPCIHAFCLKCIERLGEDSQPGDELPCPTCRKSFIVPNGGFRELPKNIYFEKVMLIRRMSYSAELNTSALKTANVCEVCGQDQNVASMYCVDCEEKMCKACSETHRRMKVSRNHRQTKLDQPATAAAESDDADASERQPADVCQKHSGKLLELFCLPCKVVACSACFAKEHNTHMCSSIDDAAAEFRRELTDCIRGLTDEIAEYRKAQCDVRKNKKAFADRVQKVGAEISDRAELLKSTINTDKEKLMSDLETTRTARLKSIQNVEGELEMQISLMEGHKRVMEEFVQSASPCSIATQKTALHGRAETLMKCDDVKRATSELLSGASGNIRFLPSDIQTAGNTVGKLDCWMDAPAIDNAGPLQAFLRCSNSGSKPITGLALLNGLLFLVRSEQASIDVYDTTADAFCQPVVVPSLGDVISGLASCTVTNSLYVSDGFDLVVHRIKLTMSPSSRVISGIASISNWQVTDSPVALSVVNQPGGQPANVLVVFASPTSRLVEHTADGSPVREVNLEVNVEFPQHAVALASGLFVVAERSRLHHRVFLVDAVGRVTASYGGLQGSAADGLLNGPVHLTVSGRARRVHVVFVADRDNNRIVVLDGTTMTGARDLPIPADCVLESPRAVCVDESSGRLYVGEWKSGRLLVFDAAGYLAALLGCSEDGGPPGSLAADVRLE